MNERRKEGEHSWLYIEKRLNKNENERRKEGEHSCLTAILKYLLYCTLNLIQRFLVTKNRKNHKYHSEQWML